MKLALVLCLALCMSMVMTAPMPIGTLAIAVPAVSAGLPTLAIAGSGLSGATSIAGLKTLGAAGLLAANSNRGRRN